MYPCSVLAFDAKLEFDPAREEQFFSAIPSHSGIFLIENRSIGEGTKAKPYLARTADLRRAAERLLRQPDTATKRLSLREVAKAFRYRVTGSRFEQALALYEHARANFRARYRSFLHLRPPALLKVNLRNSYPRCYVTRRILDDGGYYFGPFSSRRAAESFANHFLDLFKVRRCQIKIRCDPHFPGCIYSEMKMCLAPCFAGCTKEEYDAEVRRAVETLESQGSSLVGGIEHEREAASEAMDFERAAGLHKKLEKVTDVLRGLPEVVRRIDAVNAVVLQRAAQEQTVGIFTVLNGLIAEPLFFCFGDLSSEPRSVEEIIRQHFKKLESEKVAHDDGGQGKIAERNAESATEREEHLSLLARWFYSKPRAGEILFRDAEWPYRKILRACARVLAAEESA
ncbi:MAG TPA: hypothetical protein VGR81_09100 [Candidatus Acidoferrales bacterium]|nr:hypothetical protein [Candidatus Acidoferrales bacterium]